MIRDNGPGVLLLPVKLMKVKGPCELDNFAPLHKAGPKPYTPTP